MNIPFISGILSYLQGDGAAILPEMELVLFGLGILLIDFWIEQNKTGVNRYFNPDKIQNANVVYKYYYQSRDR